MPRIRSWPRGRAAIDSPSATVAYPCAGATNRSARQCAAMRFGVPCGPGSRRGGRRVPGHVSGQACRSRIRRCVTRRGRGRFRGARGVRRGVAGVGAQTTAQRGKQRLGIHAQVSRHAVGDVPGEHDQQQAQDFGITVLDGRVEQRAGFGTEAGTGFRGERGIVVARHRRLGERSGPAPRGAEPSRKAAGSPGRRVSGPWRGMTGCRRRPAPRGAGESEAAGDDTAHGAAEAGEDARTTPLAGLGSQAGREGCGWHLGRALSIEFLSCQE